MCTNGTLCILSSPMTLCATVKIYPYFSSILTNEPDPILIKLFPVSAILLIAIIYLEGKLAPIPYTREP